MGLEKLRVHMSNETMIGGGSNTGGTISGNDVAFGERNTTAGQVHAIYFDSSPTHWRNATAGSDDTTEGYGFWLND